MKKPIFTKYFPLNSKKTQPMTPKSNKFVLNPDAYVSDQITMNRFLNYCKENVKKEESLKFEDIIRCQKY